MLSNNEGDYDLINVKLISHTPDPEKVIATAAKLCYSNCNINDIMDGLTDERAENFVEMLSNIGHESPIEHVSFTFAIEGVSRAFLAQITRHRIASYSVQSQRYVNKEMFEYVIPPEIENIKDAKEKFINAMNEDQKTYNEITGILKNKYLFELIEKGIDEKEAQRISEKKAIEDARFILPNACETKMICTFNARSLYNLFKHRCCNRAQWEIRDVAIKMLEIVMEVCPSLFKYAGPECLRGKCPEGKMSCKEMKKVNEFFANMKAKYLK